MFGSTSVVYTTALMVGLAVGACARQPTAANVDDMSVAISIGHVQVRSAQNAYVDATIPLVVTNAGAEAVFLNPCAPVLERSVDGDWQPVFAQACPLDTSVKDVEIAASTERTVEFAVRTDLGSGSGYRWAPPLDGVYRIRTSLRNASTMLPASVGVTSSFRLPAP